MKKVLLVFAMGAFLFSCGGPSTCDCVNKTDEQKKDEDFMKACEEMEKEWEAEYDKADDARKKEMKEEVEACEKK